MHADGFTRMVGDGAKHLTYFGHPKANRCGEEPTIHVIVGDTSLRESLEVLLRAAGWKVLLLASASGFLALERSLAPCCLILDAGSPERMRLDQQQHVDRSEAGVSTIFLLEHPDVPTTVCAMRAGAVEVLTKPVDGEVLLNAVDEAIRRSRIARDRHAKLEGLRQGYASLTPRECEVMSLVVSGLLNKQIGGELSISEPTVKAHRGQIMRKMRARSLPHLVGMASSLGLVTTFVSEPRMPPARTFAE